MDALRTPNARFVGLSDYAFAPHYREVRARDGAALRFHFLDEGPRGAAPVLLLHGNPTWCYLYRPVVAGLVARGHRVVALDLMGMGRSDKPVDEDEFTIEAHLDWMGQWLEAEDLSDVTLFCQDWGGILGLCLLPDHGDRFARVVVSNTGLPEGRGMNRFMQDWLAFSQSQDELPVGALVQAGSTRELTDAEMAAYEAPFPDGSFQASPKRFPLLIPLQPDNPGVPRATATGAFLESWTKPNTVKLSHIGVVSSCAAEWLEEACIGPAFVRPCLGRGADPDVPTDAGRRGGRRLRTDRVAEPVTAGPCHGVLLHRDGAALRRLL